MAGRQARLVIEGGKVRACVVDEEAVAAEKEREAKEERREERAEQRAAARRERERQRERAARERQAELDRRRRRQEDALAELRRRRRRRLYDSESDDDEGGFTSSSTDSSESTIPALAPAVSESGSEPRGRSLGEEEERSSDESDGGTSLSSFCTSGDGTESGDSSIDYGCDLAARQLREK